MGFRIQSCSEPNDWTSLARCQVREGHARQLLRQAELVFRFSSARMRWCHEWFTVSCVSVLQEEQLQKFAALGDDHVGLRRHPTSALRGKPCVDVSLPVFAAPLHGHPNGCLPCVFLGASCSTYLDNVCHVAFSSAVVGTCADFAASCATQAMLRCSV